MVGEDLRLMVPSISVNTPPSLAVNGAESQVNQPTLTTPPSVETVISGNGCCMGSTILLVDDDEDALLFLRFALKHLKAPHALRHTTNGFQAMEYLKGDGAFADRLKHPIPDLILLDLKMPLMDGFELLAWLRNQPELDHLPAVVLTGSSYPADLERAYRLGANSVVLKPVDLLDFLDALKQVLNSCLPTPPHAIPPPQVEQAPPAQNLEANRD